MNRRRIAQYRLVQLIREVIAILCVASIIPGNVLSASTQTPPAVTEEAIKLPPEQLDSLVAPIALYPDPLLSQTLVASTYPLEVIQLKQWMDQNKNLAGKALTDAVQKQDWDPSIQALAPLPDVVKTLADNIKWTTDLGNAFLAQQSDVMDAVQRMRTKAQNNGTLKSTQQQKVETTVIDQKSVVVIEQTSPEVVYVPSYNPTVVYGAPMYPYPPISYPPPGYYAAGMAISFGVGIAMGAAWGGGWGWGCGWGGHNNVYINNNNNFVRNSNRQNINNTRLSTQPARANSAWQHNPQHRGGAPYSDRTLANKYGGTARGDSMANRQANARQNQARQLDRQPSGGGNRAGTGGRQPEVRDRSAGVRDSSMRTGGANRGGMDTNRVGADRVGNRQVPNSPGATNRSAFGGSGMSGNSARASSARGASSMSRSGGWGGGSRSGGGSRGGGRRR